MNGDITRSTYRPDKGFSAVRQQQGRVPMDADWNEQLDIQAHHDQAVALDVIGACGAPEVNGGFQVTATPDAKDLLISAGHIYVDGILCELNAQEFSVTLVDPTHVQPATQLVDGRPLAANQWLEISVAGQPVQQVRIISIDQTGQLTLSKGLAGAAAGTVAMGRRMTTYLTQPDLPNPAYATAVGVSPPGIAASDGTYLVYLDVWERPITALEDPSIREVALGGPDTTTRTKTTAQVKLLYIPSAQAGQGCKASFQAWDDIVHPPSGRLAARSQPAQGSTKPCILPAQAGYDQLLNQLYRVEIREKGGLTQAKFTYSRENASVQALWLKTTGNDLQVSSSGKDSALGFAGGQYVELTDDGLELAGAPGPLTSIATVTGDVLTVVPPTGGIPPRAADTLHPRVKRWDSLGELTVDIPATNGGWIPLEHGVEVKFADGQYRPGDYWLIPARTITGDVEWLRDDLDIPVMKAPDGIAHHFCRLGVVKLADQVVSVLETCVPTFPFLTEINADDVAYTGTCQSAGPTVETAIDFLCSEKDLRFHNEHLHGTGIVCGLQVHCDFDQNQAGEVKILSGYAIDCSGNDLRLNKDRVFDVVTAIQNYDADPNHANAKIINGTEGEAELILLADQSKTDGIDFAVVPFDESKDTPEEAISASLLMDYYRDCILPLVNFYKTETTPAEKDKGRPDTPQDHLRSSLINLAAQLVNQPGGEHIFVSKGEDALIHKFYDDLRALLRSETFCAMFANARPFPDYNDANVFPTLSTIPIDTVFAKGEHVRLRLRPKTHEAYSVGPGINPLTPSTTLNRYDLDQNVLLAQVDPMAGTTPPKGTTTSGSGSVQDVAFSPDGGLIYVVIPTKDGKDTFFRYGEMVGKTIKWGNLSVICGVKLMSLATTAADPKVVYATGLGKGIYKIDPFNVAANALPQFPFTAVGDLAMAMDGRYFATASSNAATTSSYDQVAMGTYKDAANSAPTLVALPQQATGTDGLAIDVQPNQAGTVEAVYVVSGPDANKLKSIRIYDLGASLWVKLDITLMNTAVSLAALPGQGTLLVTLADDYSLRLLNLASYQWVTVAVGNITDNILLPLQVAPVSVAVDAERGYAYALNYASNTISTMKSVQAGLLSTTYDTGPLLDELATYRQQVLDAFADLLGGLAEYLKDCLCDHFLINNPSCNANNQTLYLGAIRIKQTAGQWAVYRVCNFTKRHYVKSFPTMGYWLSLIPVIPLVGWAIGKLCCMILPDQFGKYNAPGYTPPPSPPATTDPPFATVLQQAIGNAQGQDLPSKLAALLSKGSILPFMAGQALGHPMGFRLPIERPGPAASGGWAIVNQSADNVAAALRTNNVLVTRTPFQPGAASMVKGLVDALNDPPPGSQVTLHEEAGVVRYYTIDPNPSSTQLQEQVTSLSSQLQAKDNQIQELQTRLVAVQQKQEELAGSLQAEWVARQAFREELMQIVTQGGKG